MRKYVTIAAILLAGCGGGADTVPLPLFDQENTAALMYNDSYQVPVDFYVDELDGIDGYTLYHVLNESGSYELCTDNINQAIDLEAADHATRTIQGDLVGWRETERFFEFERMLNYSDSLGNAPTYEPGFARIFKCSYVDRTGVDRVALNGFAGTTTVPSQEMLEELSEYLWRFTFWWPQDAKVLGTWDWTYTDGVIYNTIEVGLRTVQSNSECDLIEVWDWEWSTNNSGTITTKFILVDSFEARYVNGVVSICGTST